MKGFDPKFNDFTDYILGITKEIWEDRNIATLDHYYSEDIIVRSPSGVVEGNQGVVAATLATLAEFPDRTLLGEDVIWSGSPEEGMLSSHRIFTTATHTGNGVYGNATGKRLAYRVIADCHAINNQINDEWLIRDQGAVVRQLGYEPLAYARQQIECERNLEEKEGSKATYFHPDSDKKGPYLGQGNDNEWGQRYGDILQRIMGADLAVIPEQYDRACQLEYPGGYSGHSLAEADHFWAGLRASFPYARFNIEHQIGREDPMMPPRAAIRWSLHGKHDGWGHFGQPSGAEVYVMGAAHVEFGPWGIRREYVLFDETMIWKQIALKTG